MTQVTSKKESFLVWEQQSFFSLCASKPLTGAEILPGFLGMQSTAAPCWSSGSTSLALISPLDHQPADDLTALRSQRTPEGSELTLITGLGFLFVLFSFFSPRCY